MRRTFEVRRWVAVIAIVGLIAVSCRSGDDADPDDTEPTNVATSSLAAPTQPTTSTPIVPVAYTYRVAILGDIQTDNAWAMFGTVSNEWTTFILQPTVATLYRTSYPNYMLTPSLAADVIPPTGVPDGDNWVIDVTMRDGLVWSDGSPLTAGDVAFTFNTVADLGLVESYLNFYPLAVEDNPDTTIAEGAEGLIAVEALSDVLLRYTWSANPGLEQWHFGAAQGPIFSEAFWGPHVEAAAEAADLYAVSGADAPSAGPMVFESWVQGGFVRMVANPNPNDAESTNIAYQSGGFASEGGAFEYEIGDTSGDAMAVWDEGPNSADTIYSIYETQNAAVQALVDGDVDYILNETGIQRSLQSVVKSAVEINEIVNPANLFRYLAFNTRRFPGSNTAFRQAMACLIDKEFVASDILQGEAIPVDSLVPPGNTFWANPGLVSWCEGQTRQARVESAVQLLKDAGWTWTTEPGWNEDNLDVIPKGQGLRGPNGETIPDLQLLVPVTDPLRSTFGLYIDQWANDIGIPVSAELTGFSEMVDRIFGPTDWDMYILGWVNLSTYPSYIVDFFESSGDSATGGYNIPGYTNADFDTMANQFRAAADLDDAADKAREMDAMIARDVPYVVLFTTPIFEAYRTTVEFPTTAVLDGLQGFGGLTGSVNTPR